MNDLKWGIDDNKGPVLVHSRLLSIKLVVDPIVGPFLRPCSFYFHLLLIFLALPVEVASSLMIVDNNTYVYRFIKHALYAFLVRISDAFDFSIVKK